MSPTSVRLLNDNTVQKSFEYQRSASETHRITSSFASALELLVDRVRKRYRIGFGRVCGPF